MPGFQDWPNFKDDIDCLRNYNTVVSILVGKYWHVIQWQNQFFVFYINEDHLISNKGTYSTVFEIFKLDPSTGGLYIHPETGQPLIDPSTQQPYDDTRYIIRLVSTSNSLSDLKKTNQLYQNVYPVSDVFRLDDDHYAVVAHYLGECLHNIDTDQLGLIDSVDILLQTAMQLNLMLKQRTFNKTCMLHRDLKASNVVYQKLTINDNRTNQEKRTELLPSIIDFGLSEYLDYPYRILYKRDIKHPNMDYFTPETQPDVFGKAYYSGATDIGMFLEIYQRLLAGNMFGKKQQGRFPIHRIEVDPQWHCHDFNLTACLRDFAELLHNEWPHKRPDADVLLRFFQQVSRYCHIMQLLTDMPAPSGSTQYPGVWRSLWISFKRCYDYLETQSQLKQQLQATKAQLILLSMGAWSMPIMYCGQAQSFEDLTFYDKPSFCQMVIARQSQLMPARVAAILALQHHKGFNSSQFVEQFVFSKASMSALLAINRLALSGYFTKQRFNLIYQGHLNDEHCQAIESLGQCGLLTENRLHTIANQTCSFEQLHALNQLVDKGWHDPTLLEEIMPDEQLANEGYHNELIKLLPYIACSRAIYDPTDFKKFVNTLSYAPSEILTKLFQAINQRYGLCYDNACLRQTMFNIVLINTRRDNKTISHLTLLALVNNTPLDLRAQQGVTHLLDSSLVVNQEILIGLLAKAERHFWYHVSDWCRNGLLKPHLLNYPLLNKLADSSDKQQTVSNLLKGSIYFHSGHINLCSADTCVAQFYRRIVQANQEHYSKECDDWLVTNLRMSLTLREVANILTQHVKYKTDLIQNYNTLSIDEAWQALGTLQMLNEQQSQLIEQAYPYRFQTVRQNLLRHVIQKVFRHYDSLLSVARSKQSCQNSFVSSGLNNVETRLAALYWLIQLLKSNPKQTPVEINSVNQNNNDVFLVNCFNPVQADIQPYMPSKQQFAKFELRSVLQTERDINRFVQPLLKELTLISAQPNQQTQLFDHVRFDTTVLPAAHDDSLNQTKQENSP